MSKFACMQVRRESEVGKNLMEEKETRIIIFDGAMLECEGMHVTVEQKSPVTGIGSTTAPVVEDERLGVPVVK